MKWNEEVSPRFKRIFAMCLVAGLIVLSFAMCSGHPANAETPPTSRSFVIQAHLDVLTTARSLLFSQIGNKRTGPCWGLDKNFPVTDALGTEYAPGFRVQWCSNPKQTRVNDVLLFQCYDAGGYYDYDGCKKSKGSLGYYSLGLSTSYAYHHNLGLPGVTLTANPYIIFSVYANGVIAGTVYYDN